MFLNNLSKDFRDIDCNNETVEKKKKYYLETEMQKQLEMKKQFL